MYRNVKVYLKQIAGPALTLGKLLSLIYFRLLNMAAFIIFDAPYYTHLIVLIISLVI